MNEVQCASVSNIFLPSQVGSSSGVNSGWSQDSHKSSAVTLFFKIENPTFWSKGRPCTLPTTPLFSLSPPPPLPPSTHTHSRPRPACVEASFRHNSGGQFCSVFSPKEERRTTTTTQKGRGVKAPPLKRKERGWLRGGRGARHHQVKATPPKG